MSFIARIKENRKVLLSTLALLILLLGIVLRIVVYLQNRDLFIDEANVARNIYERGFSRLALPLSYEQYAPPIFLWLVKLSAVLFGYGEYALRLYPLIAGILSMIVFYSIAKRITSLNALWYPLFLLATSYIFVRYSSELKQYMNDVLVVLSLIWLALRIDIIKTGSLRFGLLWFLMGSIAIWACMPSVFALAGVGIYYLVIAIKSKHYKRMFPVIITGFLWIAQFLFYYITILKPQAESSYLQNFHAAYFLFLLPNGKEQLFHNWHVFKEILEEAGGYQFVGWIFNLLLLIYGVVILLRKNIAVGLLLVVPLLAALFAAALHEYSLIPRVALFMMPVMLLLIGFGLHWLLNTKLKVVQLVVIVIAIITAKNNNSIRMLWHPYKNEQMTDELSFLKQYHITGKDVYIHHGAGPAYIYYTEIHPKRLQWAQFAGAHILLWNTKYGMLSQSLTDTSAFLYTAIGYDDLMDHKATIESHMKEIAHTEDQESRCYAYIYVKR